MTSRAKLAEKEIEALIASPDLDNNEDLIMPLDAGAKVTSDEMDDLEDDDSEDDDDEEEDDDFFD